MSTTHNKATVDRLYQEVINQERRATIDEIVAADAVIHDPLMGTQHGIESFKRLLGIFDTAFPHHRVEVHHVTAEGEYVSVLHTHIAHHAGPFMDVPPTYRTVRVGGLELLRLRDGKIVEFWRHDDDAGLLMQLGVVPEPQTAAR